MDATYLDKTITFIRRLSNPRHSPTDLSFRQRYSLDPSVFQLAPFSGMPSFILQLLGEVYRCLDRYDPSLPDKWMKQSDSLTVINVSRVNNGPIIVYNILGIQYNKKPIINCNIYCPGTHFSRPTGCFIYWPDKIKGGCWGIKFVSERDASRFLQSCTSSSCGSRQSYAEETGLHNLRERHTSVERRRPKSVALSSSEMNESDGLYSTITVVDNKQPKKRQTSPVVTAPRRPAYNWTPNPNQSSQRKSDAKPSQQTTDLSNQPDPRKFKPNHIYAEVVAMPNRPHQSEHRAQSVSKSSADVDIPRDSSVNKCHHNIEPQNYSPQCASLINSYFEEVCSSEQDLDLLSLNVTTDFEGKVESFGGIPHLDDGLLSEVEMLESPTFDEKTSSEYARVASDPGEQDPTPRPSIPTSCSDYVMCSQLAGFSTEEGSDGTVSPGSNYTYTSFSRIETKEGVTLADIEDSRKVNRHSTISQTDSGFDGVGSKSSDVSENNELHDSSVTVTTSGKLESGNPLYTSTEDPPSDDAASEISYRGLSHNQQRINQLVNSIDLSNDGRSECAKSSSQSSEGRNLVDNELNFQCRPQSTFSTSSGSIRKAGYLQVKHVLYTKKRKLEPSTKRKWRKTWLVLRGTMLLFHGPDQASTNDEVHRPDHILDVEGSIAQSVPEHSKRDNVFAVSTASGDVYLMQAPSLVELENWITAIHCTCSTALAKQKCHEETVSIIQDDIRRMEHRMKSDFDAKKMAELHMSVTTDKRKLTMQIYEWEQNIEKLNCDIYRLRCYLASLQGTELPNPKTLLASVSRNTKTSLSKLGCFSASSVHAYLAGRHRAREPMIVGSLERKNKHGVLSVRRVKDPNIPATTRRKNSKNKELFPSFDSKDSTTAETGAECQNAIWEHNSCGKLARVRLPSSQKTVTPLNPETTAHDLLSRCCLRRKLDPRKHYLKVRIPDERGKGSRWIIPDSSTCLEQLNCQEIELVVKWRHDVELIRRGDVKFGIEYETIEEQDPDGNWHPRLHVRAVFDGSVAEEAGLVGGDEILTINGKSVRHVEVWMVDFMLKVDHLVLDVLSQYPPPNQGFIQHFEDMRISSYGDEKRKSIVSENNSEQSLGSDPIDDRHVEQIDVTQLGKAITELYKTEKTYNKDLEFLVLGYLEPLLHSSIISEHEMESLTNSAREMMAFQRNFFRDLGKVVDAEPDYLSYQEYAQFRTLLFGIADLFKSYTEQFKLYSNFIANHNKAQKLLVAATDKTEFKMFMEQLNQSRQQSQSLDSYLIKPTQRVVQYPLILQRIQAMLPAACPENQALEESVRLLRDVGDHINEMNRIYAEFGSFFEMLMLDATVSETGLDLPLNELLVYGTAYFTNCPDEMLPKKHKYGNDVEVMLFVFKRAVVLLGDYKEKSKTKRRTTVAIQPKSEENYASAKIKIVLPSSQLQVKNSNVQDGDNRYLWDLICSRSVYGVFENSLYRMCSSSLENKQRFMKAIRTAINEYTKRRGNKRLEKMRRSSSQQPCRNNHRFQHISSCDTMSSMSDQENASRGEEDDSSIPSPQPSHLKELLHHIGTRQMDLDRLEYEMKDPTGVATYYPPPTPDVYPAVQLDRRQRTNVDSGVFTD